MLNKFLFVAGLFAIASLNGVIVKNLSNDQLLVHKISFTIDPSPYLGEVAVPPCCNGIASEEEIENAQSFAITTQNGTYKTAFMNLKNHHEILFDHNQTRIMLYENAKNNTDVDLKPHEKPCEVSVKQLKEHYMNECRQAHTRR